MGTKRQFVKELSQDGQTVDDKFAVKYKKPPTEYKGPEKKGKWFDVRLSDGTGEINLKYWGRELHETEKAYASIAKGDIVHVRGTVQEYPRGSKTFSITVDPTKGELRKCAPDEYAIEEFIAKSPKDPDKMLSEMKMLLSGISDHHLKKLTEAFLEDASFMKSFTKSPAAMEYHQNYVSGLLEHTLNTMKLGLSICDVHPGLDRDLVATGAFLHDVGKTRELGITGAVIDVTEEGMMLGHIPMGYEMVEQRISQIHGFPKELRLKVLHIMLSHHGLLEHGSPKKPQLPEAFAIYHADSADAEIDLYLRLKRDANTEDSWLWVNKKVGHV